MLSQNTDSTNEQEAFLDEVYYKPIEAIIKRTNKPELRPTLEEKFGDWLLLDNSILEARDLEEVSQRVDAKAKALVQAINVFNERRASEAEIEKSTFRKKMYERKEALLERLEVAPNEEIDPELHDMMQASFRAVDQIVASVDRVEEGLVHVSTQPLKKAILYFKIKKFSRRCLRELERFFLAIVVFGVLLGSAVSESAKLLFQNHWKLVLLCGASWNILKEYKIGPWLRKKRLEKSRRDLRYFLNEVFETDIQLVIHTSFEKDRAAIRSRRREIAL